MENERTASIEEIRKIGLITCFDRHDVEECLDELLGSIKDNIVKSGVDGTWMLFGKKRVDKKYVALQVASSTSIDVEIKRDLKRMIPVDLKKDAIPVNSYFVKNVCKVAYGLDPSGQKYIDIFKKYDDFCIVIVDLDKIRDTKGYERKQFAEVSLAYKYQARYWNPSNFNQERQILGLFEKK